MVVLMYHGFTASDRVDDPENLFVRVDAFERQLGHLLRRGWQPLDLDAYLAVARGTAPPPRRSFLITIDDGFDSVRELAAPVLTRLDVPAVLFVPSGLVGRTATWLDEPAQEPIIDATGLLELAEQAPVEIGGHGHDHCSMAGLEPDVLRRNSTEVRESLERVLQRDVRAFAYPYGDHDASARAAVAEAGYLAGFSVFDDAGPFAVSRVDVNSTDTLRSFRLKTLPGYRRLWRLLSRARVLRRTVRFLATRGGGP